MESTIFQRFAVTEQLLVSLVEIFLFAFVFPAETALFPNVGKAAFLWLASVRRFVQLEKLRVLDHALLITEKIRAGRIGFIWCRLVKQPAQVVKMALVGGSFLALVA